MNEEALDHMIEKWEQPGEVVRTINNFDDTIERIVKYTTHRADEELYALYRYFTLGINRPIEISIDLQDVDADRVIQHLAERL